MNLEATQHVPSSQSAVLYMAFDLGKRNWYLAFSTGVGDEIYERQCKARSFPRLFQLINEMAERFGVEEFSAVRSAYEAGFDAFWLHRVLVEEGIENLVVDSASIEGNRRGRRSKSDRIDARQLLRKSIQYWAGDREVFSVCKVPSRGDEDDRRMERDWQTLSGEKTAHTNRMKGLLQALGIFDPPAKVMLNLDTYNLGAHEKANLRRENARLELVKTQLAELAAERDARLKVDDAKSAKTKKLMRLRGLGARTSWGLVAELFGWRKFDRRDQVTSFIGYDSAPYDTGDSTGRSQGISKAGSRWVRAIVHSLVTNWLLWQPDSDLSRWYEQKYGNANRAERRKGRVALGRKILVCLWRYLERDELPRGAIVAA